MPFQSIALQLKLWRTMGGTKLSLLGGEPTLHPEFLQICAHAKDLGYEKIIINTNGLAQCAKQFVNLRAQDVSYVQLSLDGGSAVTHDFVRGKGMFDITWKTICSLVDRGFDTRVICTVNSKNKSDCVDLIEKCDAIGVRLVKFHVFSDIGNGAKYADWVISPEEWIAFYESLEGYSDGKKVQVWYQPTYANERNIDRFYKEGYRGCIGRALDRISVFPDGRAYVCSYLFDTNQNMFFVKDGKIVLNKADNEFDLFTSVISKTECQNCAAYPS
jgi:MoaA/NifB/PqqE/SkfB family radical SAM enzyme